ncbi:CLUMA_CG010369, isoform A [Clunio marinus]|uniref:CLUMA_CG010369, isoform A n=1 Tax=Clunio marinus TaxID=568069 RepID=A0A1J1IDC8_9DIPT|nr:CLUMA_CG010369, isoform A [Clunio marinus]
MFESIKGMNALHCLVFVAVIVHVPIFVSCQKLFAVKHKHNIVPRLKPKTKTNKSIFIISLANDSFKKGFA